MKMTVMEQNSTQIKVHPTKIDEMLAKGWVIIVEEQAGEITPDEDIDFDDSEEE